MKRLVIGFAVISLAFCAYLYFTIVGKESEKKSDQTAAARAARWAKKPEIKESESIIENEKENEIET